MSCKHEVWKSPEWNEMKCAKCNKTQHEIDLEAKLEAANDELSKLNREISELRRGEGRGE